MKETVQILILMKSEKSFFNDRLDAELDLPQNHSSRSLPKGTKLS